MTGKGKLRISGPKLAMTVTRDATKQERLVYVIRANKGLIYTHGKSKIAYVGRTEQGNGRIASSADYRSRELLKMRGVISCDIQIVTAKDHADDPNLKLLERAILILFREKFGTVPKLNIQGKGILKSTEFDLFSRDRIESIIDKLSN
jgi:hypothetical protein